MVRSDSAYEKGCRGLGEVADIVEALAWPVAVLAAVVLLRKHLASALGELGRRTSKLDLRVVTLEFQRNLEPGDWQVNMLGDSTDVRHLTSSSVFDSWSRTLFEQLADTIPIDVLVLDLGKGHEWLTTRLYLFSSLLERLRGVRCIVALHTHDGREGQVLGSISPTDLRAALNTEEPWLEPTYVSAWNEILGVLPAAGHLVADASADQVTIRDAHLAAPEAMEVARAFIRLNQRFSAPEGDSSEWQEFQSTEPGFDRPRTVWEHTIWIDPAALPRSVARAIDSMSLVRTSPTHPQGDLKRRILLQERPFVVLIERDGTLRGVVDRVAMLDQAVRATLNMA